MRAARWRGAIVVPILALMAMPIVQAADAPPASEASAPAPALPTTPPAAAAPGPRFVPVPLPDATVEAEPESSWSSNLLAPLRQFGVETWWDVFQMQPWTGTLGFTFDDQEQRIRAPGSPRQVFSNRLL